LSEIAAHDFLEPEDVLHDHGLIEPVCAAQFLDVRERRLIAEHQRGRVSGGEPRQEEHHRGDDVHDDEHPRELARNRGEHGIGLPCRERTGPRRCGPAVLTSDVRD